MKLEKINMKPFDLQQMNLKADPIWPPKSLIVQQFPNLQLADGLKTEM